MNARRPLSLTLPLALCVLATFSPVAARAQDKAMAASIQKVGADVLRSPLTIRATPNGDLLIMDKRGDQVFAVRFNAAGETLSQTPLPASIAAPSVVMGDSSGQLFVLGNNGRGLWQMKGAGEPQKVEIGIDAVGAALKKTAQGESLFLLERHKPSIKRLQLPNLAADTIALSAYPDSSGLSEPRVRDDGHIYAFAFGEQLVWHFDAQGRFIDKFGGGGPAPPKVGMPADFMGQHFDVAPNGDIFWSLADYGALLKLSADHTLGAHFRGQESWNQRWTGQIHTLTGMALVGSRAFVIDTALHRATGFPLSIVQPGAKDVDSVDARAFGFSYHIASDTPYKLFTSERAQLSASFDQGNRSLHRATLRYKLSDMSRKVVAQGLMEVGLEGSEARKIALPPLVLPRLGWYQLETSLGDGKSTWVERVSFLSRTFADARLPIPAREVSGWNDIATHKMIGMGLHRFGGSLEAITGAEIRQQMEFAKQLKVPYFVQLTDKPNVTPDNIRAILRAYPDLPLLEVMNEPDQQGVAPEKYVSDYLKPCFEAAKAINPNIKILGPSKCGVELGWMEKFFAAGGGRYVDALSVHTYERHNSMDVYHWNWKFQQLRELADKNGCAGKPIYQTEHGFLGDYHGFITRPAWQGRSLLLEVEALQRAGIGADKNYYYYTNQGGFAGFSAYLVAGSRELYPAATLLRARAHRIGERQFAETIDFGSPGNWLLLANRYNALDNAPASTSPSASTVASTVASTIAIASSSTSDVMLLVNTGAARDIPVTLNLPRGARVFDCFSNPIPAKVGSNTFNIGRYPTYVEVPRGTALSPKIAPFGRNIAAQAKVEVDDEKARASAAQLINGALEYDFADQPERVGFLASDGKIPLDVTLNLGSAKRISSAILYGAFADNDKCTPLEYTLQARVNGAWKTLDTIKEPAPGRTLELGNISRLSEYDNPWIFVHRFSPTQTDAIRFHFTKTTHGQFPTEQIARELDGGWGNPPRPQRVELREAQVFEAP